MGKNWLIRTKSNHILGPVSKEKVVELYQNGSIKPDDEVCSGNGYWFYIRENELVSKYLLSNNIQTFNPISEAKDVITATAPKDIMEEEDITLVNGITLKQFQDDSGPLEAPEAQALSLEQTKKKIKTESLPNHLSARVLPKQNWVKYLGIMVFLMLFMILYFRKTILRTLLNNQANLSTPMTYILASAEAQDESPGKKKSS